VCGVGDSLVLVMVFNGGESCVVVIVMWCGGGILEKRSHRNTEDRV
jgi:hypothetical protein